MDRKTRWLCLGALVFVSTAMAQPNRLSAEGRGVVRAEPDRAVFTFGIEGQTDSPAVAVERADSVSGDLVRRLERIGIESTDIRSTPVALNPFMDRQSQRQLIRYSRTTTAVLHDLDQVADVYAAALDAGVNSVGQLEYSLSNYAELETQARDLALVDARDQAEGMARALGVEIGRVLSANVSRSEPQPLSRTLTFGVAAAAEPAPDYRSGTIEVTARASVDFEIIER